MRRGEFLDALHGEIRPGRGAPGLIVDVHQHQLVGGGEVTIGRVMHFVDVVDALGVVVEDLRRDAQGIAFLDLAIVGDVRLEHEGHAELVARVLPTAAELLAQSIRRFVEGHDIEAHVHVAVPVDPFRQDGRAVHVEWRTQIGLDQGIRWQFHAADRSHGAAWTASLLLKASTNSSRCERGPVYVTGPSRFQDLRASSV